LHISVIVFSKIMYLIPNQNKLYLEIEYINFYLKNNLIAIILYNFFKVQLQTYDFLQGKCNSMLVNPQT
jgi:hypothetical protein